MTAAVAAVVLGWNGRDDTLACLRTLRAATYAPLSVVVVDNASTDGGPEAVEREFPEARLIRLAENRGFAGGVNIGVGAAFADGADAVLLLNNDTTVEPGFLEPLVDAALDGRGRGGMRADPRRRQRDDLVRRRPLRPPSRPSRQAYGVRPIPPLPPATEPYETDRACGGAMLVPRSAFERVGDLDESLFAYAEDVDWSLRARAIGLRIVVVPTSVVRHRVSAATGGASSPDSLYYALRNGLIVAERHAQLGRVGTLRRRGETAGAFGAQALRSRRGGPGSGRWRMVSSTPGVAGWALVGRPSPPGGSTRLARMRDAVKSLVERGARTTPGKHLLHAATRPEVISERFSEVSTWPDAVSGFEDLAFMFTSSQLNHGVASLRFDEAAFLFGLARGIERARIVEIGRFKGGSTFIMAAAMQPGSTIASYDLHVPLRDDLQGPDLDRDLLAALERYDICGRCRPRGGGLEDGRAARTGCRSPLHRRRPHVRGRFERHRAVVAAASCGW